MTASRACYVCLLAIGHGNGEVLTGFSFFAKLHFHSKKTANAKSRPFELFFYGIHPKHNAEDNLDDKGLMHEFDSATWRDFIRQLDGISFGNLAM